jgi:hypothetical protein
VEGKTLNYALCREDKWSRGGIAPPFINSALDGGERSATRSGRFTTAEIAPGIHEIGEGRWAPEPVWKLWRRENLPLTGIQAWLSSPYPVAVPTELYKLLSFWYDRILIKGIFNLGANKNFWMEKS